MADVAGNGGSGEARPPKCGPDHLGESDMAQQPTGADLADFDLASDIATDEKDVAAATKFRNQEIADFKATEEDLVAVIDSISRETAVIERIMATGASMMQMKGVNSLIEAVKAARRRAQGLKHSGECAGSAWRHAPAWVRYFGILWRSLRSSPRTAAQSMASAAPAAGTALPLAVRASSSCHDRLRQCCLVPTSKNAHWVGKINR